MKNNVRMCKKKNGNLRSSYKAHATKARITPAVNGPDEKIPPAPGTNQIAGFVELRPLTHWEIIIIKVILILRLRGFSYQRK